MSQGANGDCLIFKLDGIEMAAPVERVRSVAKTSPLMPVPLLEDRFPGIVNFRGDLCLAIDLAPRAHQVRPFMIVLEPEALKRARVLLVDSIEQVLPGEQVQGRRIEIIDVDILLGAA